MKESIKPKECCEVGTYEHTIPMPINGRVRQIDYCVSDIVAALNAGGITTVESCCGHGVMQGYITLDDDRMLYISNDKTPYRQKEHSEPYSDKICNGCQYNISHYTSEVKCTNINLTEMEFNEVVETQKKNDKCDLWNCFCINAEIRKELKKALTKMLNLITKREENQITHCKLLLNELDEKEDKLFIEAIREYIKNV